MAESSGLLRVAIYNQSSIQGHLQSVARFCFEQKVVIRYHNILYTILNWVSNDL